jgi:DNA-binding NarL/FixJ family response regulator
MNGLEVARAVRQELTDAKILILSQHDPASLLPSAIKAGANGCVDKSRLGTDLLSSIEAIAGTAQVRGIGDSD